MCKGVLPKWSDQNRAVTNDNFRCNVSTISVISFLVHYKIKDKNTRRQIISLTGFSSLFSRTEFSLNFKRSANFSLKQEYNPVGCVPTTRYSFRYRMAAGGLCPWDVSVRGISVQGGGLPDRDPLCTESQTVVKTLPCRNFIAGGNKVMQ